jgi:hypothetical protein
VQSVTAQATIAARATQALSRLDLDFDGDSVQAVSVNGRPAGFTRQGEELVVTPRSSLPDRRDFTVQVAYTSGPREIPPNADLNKASYTIRAQPPAASNLTANGELVSKSTRNGRTNWVYEAREDLRAFLNAWLYGTKTPPMPGHPDWTVNPAGAEKVTPLAAAPARPGARQPRK